MFETDVEYEIVDEFGMDVKKVVVDCADPIALW